MNRPPVPRLRAVLLAAAALSCAASCAQIAGLENTEPMPDGAIDAAEERVSVPPEACNLVDDDFDGAIDEGFRWRLGAPSAIGSYARVIGLKGARLANGHVALTWLDDSGGAKVRVLSAILGPAGQLVAGPKETFAPQGMNGFGIAACPLDLEVGIAIAEEDSDGCANGCAIRLQRLSPADLEPLGARRLEDLDWEDPVVPPAKLLDLTCTQAGYAYLAADAAKAAWLGWFDQVFHKGKGILSGIQANEGSLVFDTLVGWSISGVNDNHLDMVTCGMYSPGGYSPVLKPKEVALSGSGVSLQLAPTGRSVAWLGSDLAVSLTRVAPDMVTNMLSRVQYTGVQVDGLALQHGSRSHSIVSFKDNLIASVLRDDGATHLYRIDGKLDLVDQLPVIASGISEHALVGGGEAPMIAWASANGTTVSAAVLECE
jgi:hypothetical protein